MQQRIRELEKLKKDLDLAPKCSWGRASEPHTVDRRNPAPPKKPWNDDSPVNTNKQWFSHDFKVVQDFVHPQYVKSDLHQMGCGLSQGVIILLAGFVHRYGLEAMVMNHLIEFLTSNVAPHEKLLFLVVDMLLGRPELPQKPGGQPNASMSKTGML